MTHTRNSNHQPNRRTFIAGTALGAVAGGLVGWTIARFAGMPAGGDSRRNLARQPTETFAMPGPLAGRVIEVHHPGALSATIQRGYTARSRPVVKEMLDRGMKELVGSDDAVGAWRYFFQPADRVGIKVVPVGRPNSISSYEVVLEVIDGLRTAGVRLNDILVFERYKSELLTCRYHEILPEGVHWECCSARYDDPQLEIDGQLPGRPGESKVSGYDPDVFREIPYCLPEHDPKDERRFRSHLSVIVSRTVDKFISIPVLKDHRSSGVTLALKNLSHGLVNNVCRSHILFDGRQAGERGGTLNQCSTFIPAMASLPAVRAKAVLHILDGIVGTWEGGPHMSNKTFSTWDYQSLLFATDPVALDHVGWQIIDRKRLQEGWPGVAQMGLDARTGVGRINNKPYPEQLHIRQPQHIPLAETLGVFDSRRIDHRRIELA